MSRVWMIALTLTVLASPGLNGCSSAPKAAPETCSKPWIFFDLGDTLVDTSTHQFKKIYFLPGVNAYLNELTRAGYKIGLIVNVPQTWGKTDQEKFRKTRSVISAGWSESQPLDWNRFDAGVLFPPTDSLRKPDPYLFKVALAKAKDAGACGAIYQGDSDELASARAAGLTAHSVTHPRQSFLSLQEIEQLGGI